MSPAPNIQRAIAEQLEDVLEMTAALAIEELWSRLMQEGLAEYSRLYRQGLGEAEIARRVEALLQGLSTKPEEFLARRAATVAYGEGRATELVLTKRTGGATYAIRSEVLDTETCEVCATLDGTVVEIGSADFHELKPPARCLGAERCRGFYVALGPRLLREAA